MLGILALIVSQRSPEDQRSTKEFCCLQRIINFIYNIQEHLLEIAVCTLTVLIDYPQSLASANILGQGNLNLVSEKSGKSQGILLSIICGNPEKIRLRRGQIQVKVMIVENRPKVQWSIMSEN